MAAFNDWHAEQAFAIHDPNNTGSIAVDDAISAAAALGIDAALTTRFMVHAEANAAEAGTPEPTLTSGRVTLDQFACEVGAERSGRMSRDEAMLAFQALADRSAGRIALADLQAAATKTGLPASRSTGLALLPVVELGQYPDKGLSPDEWCSLVGAPSGTSRKATKL